MSRIAHFALILLLGISLSKTAIAEDSTAPNISLVQINAEGMIADLKFLVLDLAGDKTGWDKLDELLPTFLEGIDQQRPLRIDILLGENQEERYRLILPVTDLGVFREALEVFEISSKKQRNGPYKLGNLFQGFMKYLKKFKYVVISEKLTEVEEIEDPLKRVQDLLKKKYDFSALITNEKEGVDARKKSMTSTRKQLLAAVKKKRDETENAFELRKLAFTHQMDELERLFAESQKMVIGWTTDSTKHEGRLEFTLKAIEGTSLEESIKQFATKPSYFAKIPVKQDGILNGRINHPLDEMRKTNFTEFYKLLLPTLKDRIANNKKLTEEQITAGSKVAELVIQMLDAGKEASLIDAFIDSNPVDGGKYIMLGGIRSKDGTKLREVVELLPKLLKDQTVELDFVKEDGLSIHKINIKERFQDGFYEQFGAGEALYVGSTPDALWMAAGINAIDRIKTAAKLVKEDPPEDISPNVIELNLKTLPWLKMIDRLREKKGNQEIRDLALKSLTNADDTFTFVMKRDGDSINGNAKLDKGILRFIGNIIAKFSKETL
ncbi:MAG: hypothetical protein K0U86_00835 [Planctomycetes bacterium]|nr:hypothetical protein [Planctomycetota bacterium]MCH9723433.1 hypothetical protein [Planctomycetota bacterium]MCH9775163.1 hypothetical protein [Planctomycetota bacterium]MDF1745454.1 hypothetical protein [Gimesia sp.]